MDVEEFLQRNDPYNLDALDIPVALAASPQWDEISDGRMQLILGGMLRNLVERTQIYVPLYREDPLREGINSREIRMADDLLSLPLISKDAVPGTGSPNSTGILGFRQALLEDPTILIPENLAECIARQEVANPNHNKILAKYGGRKILEFGSGGSQGESTVTRLSYLSVEMEAYALARALWKNGFKVGDSIACLYTPTHKGGLQLERAAEIMGMPFHGKGRIFAALVNDPEYSRATHMFQAALAAKETGIAALYAPTVRRGIRKYIQAHHIRVVESVQPPEVYEQRNAKGGALAFMTMYEEDPSAFASVHHAFLTGFPVPERAARVLRDAGIQVSTTWGSTEAMALATSAGTNGDVNDLTRTLFPTMGKVAWYRERGREEPTVEETPSGLEGMLLVTSLIGAGSTYLNYRIGDKAQATGKGYRGITRSEVGNIAGSCAADALAI